MDNERKLLLLQLKSDLREVLKLTREKSNEISSTFTKEDDCDVEKFDDLEYYLTSLLDITVEMKSLMREDQTVELRSVYIKSDSKEFNEMLDQLSQINDMDSLKEILDILEQGEHYELCSIVNEKINNSRYNRLLKKLERVRIVNNNYVD